MVRIVQNHIFPYDELNPKSQPKARQAYLSMMDDFLTALANVLFRDALEVVGLIPRGPVLWLHPPTDIDRLKADGLNVVMGFVNHVEQEDICFVVKIVHPPTTFILNSSGASLCEPEERINKALEIALDGILEDLGYHCATETIEKNIRIGGYEFFADGTPYPKGKNHE